MENNNNKFVPQAPKTYEVKYIETKEQEQQRLTAEQEQELIEDSYYFESESWSDISAPKGYGPIEGPTNRCENCPINFTRFYASQSGWYMVAGRQANGNWCCDFHRSRGIDYNQGRYNNYVWPSSNDSNPTPPRQNYTPPQQSSSSSSSATSTQRYNCSYYGCRNEVSVIGTYCPDHGGGR